MNNRETMTVPIQRKDSVKPLEVGVENAKKLALYIGLDWDTLSPAFKEKFTQMDAWDHLESSMDMNELAAKILKDPHIIGLSIEIPNIPRNRLRDIAQGGTLSDIGKRGPETATKEQSDFIVEIFKIKNVKDIETTTISQFVAKELPHFKTEEKRTEILASLFTYEVFPTMTMRQFYNLHTEWSNGILENEPQISQKVRDIVARHHALDKPRNSDTKLTFEDKFVMLLDKYDATRIRGRRDHAYAISLIKSKVHLNEFEDDKEFKAIIDAIEKIAPTMEAYA